jgi:transposase-like protein
MPILSYLHQLFNADTCHTYIHMLRMLRWKDRPLQCPRCHSQNVGPWGTYHYRPGCKRYWGNGCQRTFNDLTNTLLHQSKRSLLHWILATFLLVSPARLGALPGRWACIGVPATGGAGGCATPLCPMRCIANWTARLKRMTSITPPATRGKRKGVGRSRWDAEHVVAARNASLAGDIMIKIDRRLSRG